MSDLASRMAMLQQADSFFPGGAVAWSWGLETLFADGQMDAPATTGTRRRRGVRAERCEMLAGFVEGQLRHRWACLDRAFLVAAWRDAEDHPALRALDTHLEALTLAAELRQGSRRLGLSMLGVHASLETPGAQDYRASVLHDQAMGHLPIVQGLVWRGLGMTANDCQLAAAHGLCTGLVSAAVRLGQVGHLEAQQALGHIRPVLLQLLEAPPPQTADVHSFSPLAEVAVMRHETQELRLFAN